MKRSFFRAAVVSILLYGCTTWTLTKFIEKKLDGNYTRMLRAISNKTWRHSTPQRSSCTATYHPSRKLSKLNVPYMQGTAGELGTSSWVMYSCGPLHMDDQRQDDQLEPTNSSSVPIWDVALRTCRKQWTIIGMGAERGSWISVLIARHDDDYNTIVYFVVYHYIIKLFNGHFSLYVQEFKKMLLEVRHFDSSKLIFIFHKLCR